MKFFVDLNKVEDVKEFARKAEKYSCDIIVRNKDRSFAIDGTSLMALFSLDLSEPVEVEVTDDDLSETFKKDVSNLLAKDGTYII